MIFTDDKKELLKAVQRPDEPLSATEFVRIAGGEPPLRQRLSRHLAFLRRLATFDRTHEARPPASKGCRH